MVKKPDITLNEAKAKLPPKKHMQASDLMDADRLAELRATAQKNAERKRERQFDDIDALSAEIVARFGYETYSRWNRFEIPFEQMQRWLKAERARDKVNVLNLEAIIMSMVGACIRRNKKDPKPKGPSVANKIYREEIKIAKGEM